MNEDDITMQELRALDAAPGTRLTSDEQRRAEAGRASILGSSREQSQSQSSTPDRVARRRRSRTRSRVRLAWGAGILALTAAAVAAVFIVANLVHPLPRVEPIPAVVPEPSATPVAMIAEDVAVAACVDAWRPDPSVQSTDRYEGMYANDKAITRLVDGDWQITLVPTQQLEAEWNLYCISRGEVVHSLFNGYEDWPTPVTDIYAAAEPPTVVGTAIVGGTLSLSSAGCWVVDAGDGITAIQFPYGSTSTSDGLGVDVPGLGTVTVGDTISGSGGYGTAPEDDPAACMGAGMPLVYWQSVG